MFYLISPSVFATVSIVVRNAIDLSTVPTGTEIDCMYFVSTTWSGKQTQLLIWELPRSATSPHHFTSSLSSSPLPLLPGISSLTLYISV